MKDRQPEFHHGEVGVDHEDFTDVKLVTPNGQQYERSFDSEFLKEAGIDYGDRIQVSFSKRVEEDKGGKVGIVEMRIKSLGPVQTTEEIEAEIAELVAKVDLEKISKKFGSHLEEL